MVETIRDTRTEFGYNENVGKSYLIVKDQNKVKAIEIFKNSQIKITSQGLQHLGSVTGSKQFCKN